jgi:hypothetical protein
MFARRLVSCRNVGAGSCKPAAEDKSAGVERRNRAPRALANTLLLVLGGCGGLPIDNIVLRSGLPAPISDPQLQLPDTYAEAREVLRTFGPHRQARLREVLLREIGRTYGDLRLTDEQLTAYATGNGFRCGPAPEPDTAFLRQCVHDRRARVGGYLPFEYRRVEIVLLARRTPDGLNELVDVRSRLP